MRVLAGDFRKGRVPYDDIGFTLKSALSGRAEPIPFGFVQAVYELGHDKHGSITHRIATAAGSGLLGGVAGGVVAGTVGGPVGAAIGAVAGAILAARKQMLICRIDLRDGRSFVAIAATEIWTALRDSIARASPVPVLHRDINRTHPVEAAVS